MTQRRLLLSNDDGIHAVGLRTLATQLSALGEVWLVAPDRERSAISHAISLHTPLRVREHGPREFSVDGTPTDCVYLALHHLLPAPPDVVVSGINHGPNLGNDVLYSGTVAAAMEGAIFGHRAIAISLSLPDDRRYQPVAPKDFAVAAEFATELVASVIEKPSQAGMLLNVNVPLLPRDQIRGVKLCRLGYTDWGESVTVREDPRGKPYYWIGGQRNGGDPIADSDINAVSAGLIAVTPIHYDVTDYRSFEYTRGLSLRGFERVADRLGSGPLAYPEQTKNDRRP